MPLWQHIDVRTHPSVLDEAFRNYESCLFCRDSMDQFAGGRYADDLCVCPSCGWWSVFGTRQVEAQGESYIAYAGAVGSLANFDLSDQSVPLNEIRQYLTARYTNRNAVDPRTFENVVASVYGDIGFHAQAVGRSGDGGIDVILYSPAGDRVGIQVKRTVNTISVEQIRALVGALVIGGFTRGVFVTTSRFTDGAPVLANASAARGLPIDLVDAGRFFDQLKIAQRTRHDAHGAEVPWAGAPVIAFRPISKVDPRVLEVQAGFWNDQH